jgi:hypothetical protein
VKQSCRVYWGSHGCRFEREHGGDCECDCCTCVDHTADPLHGATDPEDEGVLCVARPPYYGPGTVFYGEDAAARGLPVSGAAVDLSA